MEIKKTVYLDHAATTPLDEKVFEKMIPYFGYEYANPSSIYKSGRKASQVMQIARQGIANILGTKSSEIIFTSSGTESCNLAILGTARANKKYGNHILVSAVEHKAVLKSVEFLKQEGFIIEYIPVDNYGVIDIDWCIDHITNKTIIVSIMYANNEIGTIQPIEELGNRLQELRKQKTDNRKSKLNESTMSDTCCLTSSHFPIFHTDACQAGGQLSLDVSNLGVDLMTLNGGKIYGPKGVGILYKKEGVNLDPLIVGGGQEYGLRSGTESIPLIVGMYEALLLVENSRKDEAKRLVELRDYCLRSLFENIPDIVLNGHPSNRLPNNIHISIPFVEGESLVLLLDEKAIQVSTGSACSSKDLEVSHVLKAIKQDGTLMHGSLRITLGKKTNYDDIDYFINILRDSVERLKSMSSLMIQL